jgi:hypothetical protein
MPTVLRSGPYRFFFYAGDRHEPPHVDLEHDAGKAKFWLEPVTFQSSSGFSRAEIHVIQRLIVKKTRHYSYRAGMTTLTLDSASLRATAVQIADDTLTVELADGRSIAVPLAWYPRLCHGTAEERSHFRLIGAGEGIHWPDLDEDISIAGIVAGRPSGESQRSLQRWLEGRAGQ